MCNNVLPDIKPEFCQNGKSLRIRLISPSGVGYKLIACAPHEAQLQPGYAAPGYYRSDAYDVRFGYEPDAGGWIVWDDTHPANRGLEEHPHGVFVERNMKFRKGFCFLLDNRMAKEYLDALSGCSIRMFKIQYMGGYQSRYDFAFGGRIAIAEAFKIIGVYDPDTDKFREYDYQKELGEGGELSLMRCDGCSKLSAPYIHCPHYALHNRYTCEHKKNICYANRANVPDISKACIPR